MATRLNRRHQDSVREKIKTSQLINRLYDHIAGKIELSATQVRGIEVLLKKTLPDLSSVEHSGEVEHNVVTAEPMTSDDWQETYTDRVGTTAGATESTH